ncbi:MAG: hypothetical protein M1840_005040 [Geoglossum simile]|nr:MAG: hypothetical protein M1840_005040 [Geoglossum simile]
MGFDSKNLAYEPKEPSFLRKLRSQQGGGDSHRHERPLARPKHIRSGDAADDPTYVDEGSNILSKAEYEALLGKAQGPELGVESNVVVSAAYPVEKTKVAGHMEDTISSRGMRPVAGIGGRKKRKAGRAVGVELQDDGPVKDGKPPVGKAKSGDKRRKAKIVKLSFAGDEGEGK